MNYFIGKFNLPFSHKPVVPVKHFVCHSANYCSLGGLTGSSTSFDYFYSSLTTFPLEPVSDRMRYCRRQGQSQCHNWRKLYLLFFPLVSEYLYSNIYKGLDEKKVVWWCHLASVSVSSFHSKISSQSIPMNYDYDGYMTQTGNENQAKPLHSTLIIL